MYLFIYSKHLFSGEAPLNDIQSDNVDLKRYVIKQAIFNHIILELLQETSSY